MTRDDDRLARASRLLRRKAGLRQSDLHGSRHVTQVIESGRSGTLKVTLVRDHFAALGAKVNMTVWWNGASLDRLLDARHAEIVNAAAAVQLGLRFRVLTEYSFNEYGERGSIDLFAGRDDMRAVIVSEVKTEWGSLEETLRRHDVKRRLAPRLATAAFGWRPASVASLLIFPDEMTPRRLAARHAAALGAYQARGRAIRAWMRQPVGDLGGIWFLSLAETVSAGSRT
jgi:hypothetical protein